MGGLVGYCDIGFLVLLCVWLLRDCWFVVINSVGSLRLMLWFVLLFSNICLLGMFTVFWCLALLCGFWFVVLGVLLQYFVGVSFMVGL